LVYVDGVNALTGHTEPNATGQDYLVVPNQHILKRYIGYKGQTLANLKCPPYQNEKLDSSNRRKIQFEVTPYSMSGYMAQSLRDYASFHNAAEYRPSSENVVRAGITCGNFRTVVNDRLAGHRAGLLEFTCHEQRPKRVPVYHSLSLSLNLKS
jgi:hypothetical protein